MRYKKSTCMVVSILLKKEMFNWKYERIVCIK